MSGAATAPAVGYRATGSHEPTTVLEDGVMRQEEGAAAHLWQLLTVRPLPAILFFGCSWFARDPKRTTAMLAVHALDVVTAALPVVLLEM